MPLLKGNLHAHTTFSDGRRPVHEVIARYRALDYDFLAITDHDDRVDEDYWFNIPSGDDRLLVLTGIETKTGRGHWGGVNADGEIVVTAWTDRGDGQGRRGDSVPGLASASRGG